MRSVYWCCSTDKLVVHRKDGGRRRRVALMPVTRPCAGPIETEIWARGVATAEGNLKGDGSVWDGLLQRAAAAAAKQISAPSFYLPASAVGERVWKVRLMLGGPACCPHGQEPVPLVHDVLAILGLHGTPCSCLSL